MLPIYRFWLRTVFRSDEVHPRRGAALTYRQAECTVEFIAVDNSAIAEGYS